MAGIYIHIPFCRSRCIYCGFYSTTRLELRQRYVDAVCEELRMRAGELCQPVETIYIGGGTPSQLTAAQLRQLFQATGSAAEVTLECNPDDITATFASSLSELPVNRVSMGVQTFDDRRLQFLHRRHSAAQIPVAVERLHNVGIQNISIDLMYGFPGETLADWQRDIDTALTLGTQHISAYSLMYEEGTPLYEMMGNGGNESFRKCDEELERQMYYTLIDRLAQAGFEHYELSNFAQPGYRSRHNSSYWTEVPYLGLGAAAHSYNGTERKWNVSDLSRYIDNIEHGVLDFEREVIDEDTRYNDLVTVALRTCEGIRLDQLLPHHRHYLLDNARRYLDDGLLRQTGDRLTLTRRGLFVSDMIMSDLIYI